MHAPKLGLTIAAAGCLFSAWFWLDAQAAPVPASAADASPLTPSPFASPSGLVGSASCAARACHGGIEPVSGQPVQQNEFTTWIGQDRHADAFSVLLTEQSKKIEMRLTASDPQKAVKDWADAKPHENVVCLNCHVFPNVKAAARQPGRSEDEVTQFGVGCEACHGPAEKWLKVHTLASWKDRSAEDKIEQGMWPVHDPLDRARRCVTCHVGSPISDMNHDLVAAGHPRLNFEFTVFMANMPPHWKKEEPANEGTAWLVGQAVTATAALELLKYRASPSENAPDRPPKPWPEFAEYDCFSCHHDLRGVPNWRQKRDKDRKPEHPPGALVWNNWYMTMPRSVAQVQGNKELLDALQRLSRAMAQPLRDRQAIIKEATEAEKRLPGLKEVAADRPLLLGLITDCGKSPPDWDRAAQLYLAIAALDHDENVKKRIGELAKTLSYPEGYDSPKEDAKKASDGPRSDFEKLLMQLSK